MSDQGEIAIDEYDPDEHERVHGYSQNVKLRELLALSEDEIVRRHDNLLSENYGNSAMGSDEYREEWYRRATLKSAQASEEYNRRIDLLLILLAVLAVIPLVLDLWDRWHWGDHLTGLWSAFCATNGCYARKRGEPTFALLWIMSAHHKRVVRA